MPSHGAGGVALARSGSVVGCAYSPLSSSPSQQEEEEGEKADELYVEKRMVPVVILSLASDLVLVVLTHPCRTARRSLSPEPGNIICLRHPWRPSGKGTASGVGGESGGGAWVMTPRNSAEVHLLFGLQLGTRLMISVLVVLAKPGGIIHLTVAPGTRVLINPVTVTGN